MTNGVVPKLPYHEKLRVVLVAVLELEGLAKVLDGILLKEAGLKKAVDGQIESPMIPSGSCYWKSIDGKLRVTDYI
jgi:hypothetical protein